MNEIRVRFAPSPTGHLHVGNARTAIFNYLFVRRSGGKYILRIEDTDIERHVEGAEEIIYEDLKWLGIDWDEGPDIRGPYGPYRQSERSLIYMRYAEILLEAGEAYYCFCSDEMLEREKQEMLEKGIVPRYTRRCSRLDIGESRKRVAAGEKAAIRLMIDHFGCIHDLIRGDVDFTSKVIGDPVMLRRDGRPTYNFAVVIDDAFMRVTHVLRGEDHLSNTPLQVKIYEALKRVCEKGKEGRAEFGEEPLFDAPSFAHLSMILGPDGARLSKRHGATSLTYFKEEGFMPQALFNYLSLLGWSFSDNKTIGSQKEIIADFDLMRVSKAAAIFDMKKLSWMNAAYIRSESPEKILPLVSDYLKKAGYLSHAEDAHVRNWLLALIELSRSHLEKMSLIKDFARPIFEFDIDSLRKDEDARKLIADGRSLEVLKAFQEEIGRSEVLTADDYASLIGRVKEKTGAKGKNLFHPLRVSITLSTSGPELEKLIPLIERGKGLKPSLNIPGCLERLTRVIHFVEAGAE